MPVKAQAAAEWGNLNKAKQGCTLPDDREIMNTHRSDSNVRPGASSSSYKQRGGTCSPPTSPTLPHPPRRAAYLERPPHSPVEGC